MRRIFKEAGVEGRFGYIIVGKGIEFSHTNEENKKMARSVFIARGEKL